MDGKPFVTDTPSVCYYMDVYEDVTLMKGYLNIPSEYAKEAYELPISGYEYQDIWMQLGSEIVVLDKIPHHRISKDISVGITNNGRNIIQYYTSGYNLRAGNENDTSTSHSNYSRQLHMPTPRNPNNLRQTLPRYPSFRRNNDGSLSNLAKEFDLYRSNYWKERATQFRINGCG